MPGEQEQYGGSLQKRIWVTRGCYFTFSDRLRIKSRHSTISITLLSFYVFIISLISIVYTKKLTEADLTAASFLSIVLSVFIVIVTLMESARKYDIDSYHAADTAHKLEHLYNKYESYLLKTSSKGSVEEFTREYAQILQQAGLRHAKLDYHIFLFTNSRTLSVGFWQSLCVIGAIVCEFIFEYWLYVCMTFLPFLLIIWFLSNNWRVFAI